MTTPTTIDEQYVMAPLDKDERKQTLPAAVYIDPEPTLEQLARLGAVVFSGRPLLLMSPDPEKLPRRVLTMTEGHSIYQINGTEDPKVVEDVRQVIIGMDADTLEQVAEMTADPAQTLNTAAQSMDLHCWCGGQVGAREPGDSFGLGCLQDINHIWNKEA